MPGGGWNKGIKNSTGSGFKGRKHTTETIEILKNRSKDIYQKPKAQKVQTNDLCDYNCEQIAKYQFANGKNVALKVLIPALQKENSSVKEKIIMNEQQKV